MICFLKIVCVSWVGVVMLIIFLVGCGLMVMFDMSLCVDVDIEMVCQCQSQEKFEIISLVMYFLLICKMQEQGLYYVLFVYIDVYQ